MRFSKNIVNAEKRTERRYQSILRGAVLLAALFSILISQVSASPPPFSVKSAVPSPELTALFIQNTGWTGGDGAYSISLGSGGALWLFGDSYIGTIKNGRREDSLLVNNTVGLLSSGRTGPVMKFFWGNRNGSPAALFSPDKKDHFYWPGDGAYAGEALYICFKELMPTALGPPGFQFSWCGDSLVRVQNPEDPAVEWRWKASPLSCQGTGTVLPHLGTACLMEKDYLYIYGVYDQACGSVQKGSVVIARIARSELALMNMKSLQYCCKDDEGYHWSSSPLRCAVLFTGGATEMTVHTVEGIEGYIATYTSGGMGPDIVLRHSMYPEGPWSDPVTAYRCPETGLYLYAGKAHRELSRKPGQIILTYCRNLGSLEEDILRPDVYYPQGVAVQLSPTVHTK